MGTSELKAIAKGCLTCRRMELAFCFLTAFLKLRLDGPVLVILRFFLFAVLGFFFFFFGATGAYDTFVPGR
jgi:hypothetical protein